MQTVLITGAAGFIGFHAARRLLDQGCHVVGIDVLNDYYDVSLKQNRLALLQENANFEFIKVDIADLDALRSVFERFSFSYILHLAAQAGVRYAQKHPEAYTYSNLVGFSNMMICAASQKDLKHFVYASTSSVYGANTEIPFCETQETVRPLSYYAATKLSNELIAQSYVSLYQMPITGLRYFTVYGPWGRPDMALFHFTRSILEGKTIDVFNHGEMQRDFTYIDDVVDITCQILQTTLHMNGFEPHPIYNISRGQSEKLMTYIGLIEQSLGLEAQKNLMPLQSGDVPNTWGDIRKVQAAFAYDPKITIQEGVPSFVTWYKNYHNVA